MDRAPRNPWFGRAWSRVVPCVLLLGSLLLPTQSGDAAEPKNESRESLATQIDRIVAKSYRGPEIPLATDFEFLRRVYLDLLGRGPTVKETDAFLVRLRAKPSDSQLIRSQLIDELLDREEFSRYFAKVLDVLFTERREVIGMLEFRNWLRQWLEERKPLNELCTEILAADGSDEKHRPAAAFFLNRNADPNQMTRDVGRIFLGRDLQCAQCHDHPNVDDYEQAEYFGIFSFVNRTYLFTDAKQGNKPYLGEKAEGNPEFSSVFKRQAAKTVAQPALPMALALDSEPDFLDANEAYIVKPEKDQRAIPRYSRRQQLAVLATHPENELFNRNLANRLWAIMMGTGVVHPVDMHHSDNPPVSAELLRLLAEELVRCRYDVRAFLREVARSRTYQQSVRTPDLRNWSGPVGGVQSLDHEMAKLAAEMKGIETQRQQAELALSSATKKLASKQSDVAKQQSHVYAAKKELQELSGQRNTEVVKLAEIRTRQGKAQDTIVALQATLKELEKVAQLTPDEQVKSLQATVNTRLTTATQTKQAVDKELPAQEKAVQQATKRVEEQRSRVLALASRKLAWTEFVVEARGGVRRAQSQLLHLQDRQSDVEQQKLQLTTLSDWLTSRERLRSIPTTADAAVVKKQKTDFDLKQTGLIEKWRRGYAIQQVRGLNGEQMGGAIYHALELDQPVRAKAFAEWEAKHQGDAKMKNDAAKRESHVTTAVAVNFWDTLEKDVMRLYSAPAGAPQDGFIATVDQALMIQNAPSVHTWLKPNPGTLTHRVAAIESPNEVARQIYLAVLARLPEAEETALVTKLLNENPKERAAILQELVWGLIASAEFRFSS